MRGGGAREPLLGGGGAPRGGAGFLFGEYAEEDALAADGAAPGLSAPTEARDGESEGESDGEGGHSRGRRVFIDDELGVAEDGWPTPGWAGAGGERSAPEPHRLPRPSSRLRPELTRARARALDRRSRAALARTPTSQALEDKLAMAYAERQRMREEWRRADPDLRHFPLLQIMLRCVGLLPLRGRGRASQRLVAALFYALQLAPYVPMLVLRRCEADEKPGATCSSFTTWDAYRMVDDAVLLGAVLYWLGSDLVVTLHHAELMGSPGVRRARQRMAKGWAVTLWLVYAVFWMALPIAELLRSTLPRPISSYDLPLGDLAVRVLWVVAGPPRACFMAGLMTSLTLVLSSARPDLKAIRAAAAVLGNRRPGSELSTEAALGQVGMLVRRYSQLAMALTQASDRVQALMAFLLAFACNVLLQACLMWTMRIDMSSDHRCVCV